MKINCFIIYQATCFHMFMCNVVFGDLIAVSIVEFSRCEGQMPDFFAGSDFEFET